MKVRYYAYHATKENTVIGVAVGYDDKETPIAGAVWPCNRKGAKAAADWSLAMNVSLAKGGES